MVDDISVLTFLTMLCCSILVGESTYGGLLCCWIELKVLRMANMPWLFLIADFFVTLPFLLMLKAFATGKAVGDMFPNL